MITSLLVLSALTALGTSSFQDVEEGPVGVYEAILSLDHPEVLQRIGEVEGRVVAVVGKMGELRQFPLGWIAPSVMEASSSTGEAAVLLSASESSEWVLEQGAPVEPRCKFDWHESVVDPTAGRMHIMSSLDGCTVLLMARDEDVDTDGSVFVYRNGGRAKFRVFQGLVQASLSPDGHMVLVQTEEEMRVYWTENYLEDGQFRSFAITGEEQWGITHVIEGDANSPGLFLLKKKLSVELYSTKLPLESTEPNETGGTQELPPAQGSTRQSRFFVETANYAVHAEYDPRSRIMVIAERHRVRVARLSEDYEPTYLMDEKFNSRSDFEVRSCLLDRSAAQREEGAQIQVGIGLRRKLKARDLHGPGSCEVQFQILVANDVAGAPSSREPEAKVIAAGGEVVFRSSWEAAERFRANSPAVYFAPDGSQLFASTRDQVWRCEVPQ